MLRRLLLGAIVVVVAVIFVVAIRRASQPLPKAPAPRPEMRQTVLRGRYTGYDPDTNKKSFQVTWESARRRADKQIEVVSPRVVFFRPSGREITITAEEGIFKEETYDGKLIGNVVVETDDGTRAYTEEIEWFRDEERDEKRVETESWVTLENDAVRLKGTGLKTEDDLSKIIILEDVEVILKKGAAGLFPSEGKEEKEGPASEERPVLRPKESPPLFVTCEGPFILDRDGNLITFSGNVRLWQEMSFISADNLEAFYGEVASEEEEKEGDLREAEIEKIKASGNVHWEDGQRSAFCQDLTYDATRKILHLWGRPLILKDAQDELKVAEVLFEQEKGRINAPNGGHLTWVLQGGLIPSAEEGSSAESELCEVCWDGDWLYDTRAEEVTFRENVRLVSRGLELSSQLLRVAFKQENSPTGEPEGSPLRVKATGDVVVVTAEPEGILRGDEFTYDGEKKISIIHGDPAEFSWPSGISGVEGRKQNILRASTICFESEAGNAFAEGQGDLVFHTREEFTPKVPAPGEPDLTSPEKKIPTQVRISWKDKASFKDNFKHLAFFKDVEMVRGTMTIRAQEFEIILQETEEGEKTLSEARAREKVLVKDEGFEARCDSLIRKEKITLLAGRPLAEVKQGANLIKSQRIEWDEEKELLKAGEGEFTTKSVKKDEKGRELPPQKTAVRWKGQMLYDRAKGEAFFTKDTELIGPEGTIKADTLEMAFEKENNTLLWLIAQGNVFVKGEERRARCNNLFWDAIKRMATLTGAPEVELWQGENRSLWRTVFYYPEENRIVCEGGAYVTTRPE